MKLVCQIKSYRQVTSGQKKEKEKSAERAGTSHPHPDRNGSRAPADQGSTGAVDESCMGSALEQKSGGASLKSTYLEVQWNFITSSSSYEH